ncbi:hypothetical protein SZ64_08485 [Erythrobacter sp. SG61-1L]|uniref:Rossmann fold domain-containing protein n=1 Tax=Erythrobacter sp. SG61-1L TaxID=1603897 RepID=UPI0006C8E84A|nr:hypothetical protein [Erythrobacter sp. SG61-1L]KPL68154.1 hypothetical protein SZ64_08485 [Erythrobacter sp. SG61-1L]
MQAVLRIQGLPEAALDAAAAFHARYLPAIRKELASGAEALVLVFPEAPYNHTGWRKAAIADLARDAAPKRVNGVEGPEGEPVEAVLQWLAHAPGITGQLLPVDPAAGNHGAGNFPN